MGNMRILKILMVVLLLLGAVPRTWAQSQTTVTAVVNDPAGNPATSGTVTFALRPISGQVTYAVSGLNIFAPLVATCNINGSGGLNGTSGGACLLWGNATISPANSCYQVTLFPNGAASGLVLPQQLISGTTYDLSSPTPCPTFSIKPQDPFYQVPAFQGNLYPYVTDTFTLGTPQRYWGSAYIDQLFANSYNSPFVNMTTGTLTASEIIGPDGGSQVLNVLAYGAKGDGSTDDTTAIQAAIDACRGSQGGSWFNGKCAVYFPPLDYVVSSTLRMYKNASNGGYVGMELIGSSKYASRILWKGSSSNSVIRMIGFAQKVADLHILDSATGWLDAIQYDGDSGVGISTSGSIRNVMIECNSEPGNGISLGRTAYQADQLTIDHPYINGCNSGYGVLVLDSNALSVVIESGNIHHNWIGVGATATSTNISIFGGEFDDNDLNFRPVQGTNFNVTGVRSETSKATMVTSVGSFVQPVQIVSYLLASTYWSSNTGQPRPATNGTNPDATHVTLSVANSVTWGDYITIAGAGPAGATLHTHIASMTDPTHAVLDTSSISTNVTGAAINLDTSVEQHNIYLVGGGPYNIQAVEFNTVEAETAFALPNGQITFTGNGWVENLPHGNPFGYDVVGNRAFPAASSWMGNWYNNSTTTRVTDHISDGYSRSVYFNTNTGGANNAWVLSNPEPLVNGLRLLIKVDTYTLRVGSNTLNYNSHGADAIKDGNSLADLTVAVPVNSYVELVWDGSGDWRLVNHATVANTVFFSTNAGGANNAWVLTGAPSLVAGLTLNIQADTYTLQVGSNTLNYNSSGAIAIKDATSGSDIATAVATGGMVTLVYNGSNWRMTSLTPVIPTVLTAYFSTNAGGGNNAWVLTGAPAIQNGLRLMIKVDTYTLQMGANTLNYNSHGTDSIKEMSAYSNLGAAVAINAYVELVWDGSGTWRLVGQ
jgi:hypothetical protein